MPKDGATLCLYNQDMDPTLSPQISNELNPFACALSEGAGKTYLALAESGLAQTFNPLPVDGQGRSLASALIDSPPDRSTCDRLFKTMSAFGLAATAPATLPKRCYAISEWSEHGASHDCAPLASLAIGAGPHSNLASFWRGLDAADLLAISSTALPMAILADHAEAAESLLQSGADPNMLMGGHWPIAARARSPEILKLLIDAGADLGRSIPAQGHGRKKASTVQELILADDSQSAGPKAMRALAISWSAQTDDPSSSLSHAAFKALSENNKDSARRCVLALGEHAIHARNAQGESLLTQACLHANFAEASRLLNFGASPFEITPSGQSPWGMLFEAAKVANESWRDRSMRERAQTLCETISSKKKYRPIPWDAQGPNGHTLLSTLAGRMPAVDFIAQAHAVQSLCKNGIGDIDGMDASCYLMSRIALKSSWLHEPKNAAHNPKIAPELASQWIQERPASHSSEASKARFAQVILQSLASLASDWRSARKNEKLYDQGLLSETPPQDPDLAKARQILEQGIQAMGRLGLEWQPLRDEIITGHRSRLSTSVKAMDYFESIYESGQLQAASAPSAKSKANASRL